MRARGSLLALLGAALLAWVAFAVRPASPPVIGPPVRTAASTPVVLQIGDLARVADRLGGRPQAAAAALADPIRNPFEFGVVRAKAALAPKPTDAAAALAALAPLVLPPAMPSVTLVGLVDREEDGRLVRIAVLSFGGRLHYVEAGARLGAAYEVVAVGPDAVDLLAVETKTPRRLVQR